jgi:hypothetical protein
MIRPSQLVSLLFCFVFSFTTTLFAQENKTPPPPVILLWPSGAPLLN